MLRVSRPMLSGSPSASFDEPEDRRIAGKPPRSVERHGRTALELAVVRLLERRRSVAVIENGSVDVDDDLQAIGARSGPRRFAAVREKGLRDELQRVRAADGGSG